MSKRINSVIIDENKVIKKNKKNIKELYDRLNICNFDNFPKIIDSDDRYISYEYIEEKKYHEVTKGLEFIKTIGELHYKTLFYKDVSVNKYKEIYDNINENIEYLSNYYLSMIEEIENEIFMSPSHYLIARNYLIIDNSLKFCRDELKKWFKKVENKSRQRVCILHNNLSLNHFIKGDKNYLISWDNYLVDTPILDLYKFYKIDGYKLDFNYLLKVYNDYIKLTEDEITLLNVLISMPIKITFIDDEYNNTINIKNIFKYLYTSMNVVNENKNLYV